MNAIFIVKILIFIAALIASRVILHRTGRRLNEQQREELQTASAGVFQLRRFLVFGVIAANFFLLTQPVERRDLIAPFVAIIFVAVTVLLLVVNFVQVRKLNLPKTVTTGYLLSVFTLLAGIDVLLLPL